MKPLDRFVQDLRIEKARSHIPPNSRVLDVGCHDGALFRRLGDRISEGIGIDPLLETDMDLGDVQLLKGTFPEDLEIQRAFDVITMLAVVEHIPEERQAVVAPACWRLLRPGGLLIITVPSPLVDPILEVLVFLRLIDGMSLEQHHGFSPGDVPAIFERQPFTLVRTQRFQLGLNTLFVFRREDQQASPA